VDGEVSEWSIVWAGCLCVTALSENVLGVGCRGTASEELSK
jgi:hypothetical protein